MTWNILKYLTRRFSRARQESNIESFAREELERAGLFDADADYGGAMGKSVMRLIQCFSDEEHSGFSAGMARSIFGRLADFEPITPLTGSDDEWIEVAEDLYQNKRCPRVFKDLHKAWDIDAVVFEDADGMRYTNGESQRVITFPYMPSQEIRKEEAHQV